MNVSRRPLFALLGVTLGAPIAPLAEAAVATAPVPIPVAPEEVFFLRWPLPRFVAVDGSVTLDEIPRVEIEGAGAVPLFEHPTTYFMLESMVTGEWHGVEFQMSSAGKYVGHRLIPVSEPQPTNSELNEAIARYFMARFFRSSATVTEI